MLQLGQGTAQHVLIAGKTGSGKSTLLHALITNLALLYSPDEVELYLVDFKKGVEFKAYAAHGLPHARVIAVESEREFGLSVLQRLDAEMKVRGEAYRAVGAQDLNSYRLAQPDVRCPRILLIVDEFQEFFTEDDRIAQDAAQLLDRLVRARPRVRSARPTRLADVGRRLQSGAEYRRSDGDPHRVAMQ